MSLGKIIWLSMLLGLASGLLAGAVLGGHGAVVGAGVAFVSVIAAGLIQPVPKRRGRDAE